MEEQLFIFTDGGSRGNPGPAAIGVTIQTISGQEIATISEAVGVGTNNEAEYKAFLASVQWLEKQKITPKTKVVWKLDSKLVVEQLLKHWKIKEPRMLVFAQEIWQTLSKLDISFQIQHVPREQNKRADELVNQALDLA